MSTTTAPLLTGTTNGHTWEVLGRVYDGKSYGYRGYVDGQEFWLDDSRVDPAILAEVRAHFEPATVASERRIAELRDRRAAQAAECERVGRPTFIRFGHVRPGTVSHNHRDNRSECGLSVYAAWRMPDGTFVLDLRDVDTASYLFGGFTARPAYRATGTVCGTGADGEPLLTGFRLRKLGTIEMEYVA